METAEQESKILPPNLRLDFDSSESDTEPEDDILYNTSTNTRAKSIPRPPPPCPYPDYISVPVSELHEDFFRKVFKMLLDEGLFFNEGESRKTSPYIYKSPDDLKAEIDFELRETGTKQEDLLEMVRKIIKYSPHPGHPYYMEQRSAGLDPYGIMADMISTAFNNNAVIYLISPSYTMMEFEVLRSVRLLAGYPEGKGDGVITPGGALASSYAMQIAIRQKYPNEKQCGVFGKTRPILFVSQAAQYNYIKGAIFQGFGMKSVVAVACNAKGQMDVADLRAKILETKSKGDNPVMVVATAGTSILRAFDPIDEIHTITQEFGLWLHVDGTWGGGCLLSATQKGKLKGVEKSDSFIWSQHFILSAPFTSSILVLPAKHSGCLLDALGLHEDANYAFVHTPLYDAKMYDTGNNHLQTSRRPEIFKFWLMWKAKGIQDLGRHIDYIFENAKYCLEEIKKRPDTFIPILDEFEGTNVNFVYVPLFLRAMDKTSEEYKLKIDKVAPALQVLLLNKGIMSISYNKLPNSSNFLTLALHSSALTKEDIVYLLNQIDNYGKNIPLSNNEES